MYPILPAIARTKQSATYQDKSLKAVPIPPASSFAFYSSAAAAIAYTFPELVKAPGVGVQTLKSPSVG
jgi:hypothetical protein